MPAAIVGKDGAAAPASEWAQRPHLGSPPSRASRLLPRAGPAGLGGGMGAPGGQLFQGAPQGVLGSGQGQRQKRRPLLARWE